MSDSAVIHHQLRQVDIIDHLPVFLARLYRSSRLCPYVYTVPYSETSITLFSVPEPLKCAFFAQKERVIVYKFSSDWLDMMNY